MDNVRNFEVGLLSNISRLDELTVVVPRLFSLMGLLQTLINTPRQTFTGLSEEEAITSE